MWVLQLLSSMDSFKHLSADPQGQGSSLLSFMTEHEMSGSQINTVWEKNTALFP